MFALEELHFDNKNRFTTFREFVHPPKVVPHHAPYYSIVTDCNNESSCWALIEPAMS